MGYESENNSSIIKKGEQSIGKSPSSLIDRGLDLSLGRLNPDKNPFQMIREVYRFTDLTDVRSRWYASGDNISVHGTKTETGNVTSLSFSPSGKFLSVVCDDNMIRLVSMDKGQHIVTFEGHENPINCLDISENEELLISGDESGDIILWDLSKPDLGKKSLYETDYLKKINANGLPIKGIKFRLNDSEIATFGSSVKVIDDIVSWIHYYHIPSLTEISGSYNYGHTFIPQVSFSAVGDSAISVDDYFRMSFWRLHTDSHPDEENLNYIKKEDNLIPYFAACPGAISGDGSRLMFKHRIAPIIDVIETEGMSVFQRYIFISPDDVNAYNILEKIPDSHSTIYPGYSRNEVGTLEYLDPDKTPKRYVHPLASYEMNGLELSHDGYVGSAGTSTGGILLLDIGDAPRLYNLQAFDKPIIASAFNSKSQCIAAANKDSEIVVWSY